MAVIPAHPVFDFNRHTKKTVGGAGPTRSGYLGAVSPPCTARPRIAAEGTACLRDHTKISIDVGEKNTIGLQSLAGHCLDFRLIELEVHSHS